MSQLQEMIDTLFERMRWAEQVEDLIEALQSGVYGDPLSYLAPYLHNEDETLASYALQVMMMIDSRASIDSILPLFDEPNWHYMLCDLLYRYGGDERIIPPIISLLETSSDPNIRHVAVGTLGVRGDARAIPSLEHTYETDTESDYEGRSIREAAGTAMEQIRSREPSLHG